MADLAGPVTVSGVQLRPVNQLKSGEKVVWVPLTHG